MVPQVAMPSELLRVKQMLESIKQEVQSVHAVDLSIIKFGTMIEVVRACMQAKQLANIAEFFSFGTNDLTQATFSFSREDAENKFLPQYNELGILPDNPFEVLDVDGVGQLMGMTVEWGRKSRGGLKVGICGEQGGHPDSIRFCHHIDLDYVSCSAPRVPIARLAAAHAKLLENTFTEE
jgi:pyruvate,orthophosphate dikinase